MIIIPARDIVKDLRAGFSVTALMEKYRLSFRQMGSVLRQIEVERRHRAERIAADVIAGLTEDQLAEKYQLSGEGLQHVLKVLLRECLISEPDLNTRELEPRRDSVIIDMRRLPRRRPATSILVQDRFDRGPTYSIRDISEEGLSLVGMEAQPHGIRRIAVLGDDFGEVAPFEFDGECRWCGLMSGTALPVAGFQIAHIAERDHRMLRDFLGRFTYAA